MAIRQPRFRQSRVLGGIGDGNRFVVEQRLGKVMLRSTSMTREVAGSGFSSLSLSAC